ncbi:NYN domain-containing protein [Poseidonibacter lekithochrous]|uniref:NYN domain-containing protein n=1 Tax=Poseidonibacter lekithochrous TaxID=1904463 RepID=UPI000D3A045B|nr:NYN domain-containing protein [Poseidonibacter lekithochrous]
MKHNKKQDNIAMLIDCDNVSSKYIDSIVNDLSKYGVVNIRKAYGNWKNPKLKGWEESLLEYAIKPIQQFDYTKGKNASDIAMVIDIMDLLYTKDLSAIALVTSDSDFSPVVSRILSDGLTVYGYGESKTPGSLVNACSQFIYTEKLYESSNEDCSEERSSKVNQKDLRKDTKLVHTLRMAVEQTSDHNGWSNIAAVGLYISQNSSFSPINYGYQKLSHLIKATGLFHIEIEGENNQVMFIKDNRY